MLSPPKGIALCCLSILLALYVVGTVSHGILRHIVQTLPLWVPIVIGFREGPIAKWSALPCVIFWLAIMVLIWSFLLGWSRMVSGHFSAVEIAMTIVVGVACLWALWLVVRWRTTVFPVARATGVAVLFFALQVLAFRISLLPSIANR